MCTLFLLISVGTLGCLVLRTFVLVVLLCGIVKNLGVAEEKSAWPEDGGMDKLLVWVVWVRLEVGTGSIFHLNENKPPQPGRKWRM